MQGNVEVGGSPEGPPPARANGSGSTVRIFGVVLSALVFNWLSALWSPSTPLLMVLVVVSLALLAMSDSDRFKNIPALSWITSLKGHGLVELGLLATIIGFACGLITLIPLWPTASFSLDVPAEIPFFNGTGGVRVHTYEVGAVAAIVLMVAISAYRAPNLRKQAVFLGTAVYGLALALSYLRPYENEFFRTFVGCLMAAAAAATLFVALPRMFRTLKEFWAIDNTRGRGSRQQEDSTEQDSTV
ncbi:hypothetical protein J2W14_000898 [Pseudarthrobacter oxydans]|uniref:hypothetical protein n=1 Tax=Pseudarthrobacter oxydans TaxID=1671 RepID=UPI0027894EC9|nr:hypothetical protein [Pseudarthrobacter oxydans]MDP9981518.1 hypothetical protein [Pseudarthrobacter oxydans]